MGFRSFVTVSVLAAAACGGSSAMRAAERGDLPALRAEIGARAKAGDLSNDEAARVARAVAERELREAKGDDAVKRVREVRACVGELDGVLGDRVKAHDRAGAEAAMALLDDGKLDASDASAWQGDKDDAWRAVGVRTLSGSEDRAARQKAMLDPSPRVRRAAMRAAQDVRDPVDFEPLSEAARLDPEPMVRTEALRAVSRLEGRGALLVMRLRDLWPAADDAIREDIAVAWALPTLYAAGGRDALAVLLASGKGPGAIAGSGAVLRAPHASKELVSVAAALLARTIQGGSRRDRLHAIAIAPVSPLVEALRKAAKEDEVDRHVRVAALARLLESERDRNTKALEEMAGQKDDRELASRARLALAHAGDVRVQAWIEQDLSASDPYARLAAADALAALGRSARGAPLLADADASVRIRAACTLMTAARVARR